MQIERFAIDGPVMFHPRRFEDPRGFFCETFRQDIFGQSVGDYTFVQDNHSFSNRRGTLRGLHYQSDPQAQGKLVRVVRGAALDVAVDVRSGSPTFGRHVSVTLSAKEGNQFWVPPGFLHGFCTLTDDVDFLYKVTAYYSAAHDGGVVWSDPDIGIKWPFGADELTLSDKDRRAPRLRDLPVLFGWNGAARPEGQE